MATYSLLEPGKSGAGLGWLSKTQEGEDIEALKALHVPAVTAVSSDTCNTQLYYPAYYGQIVKAVSGTPPIVSLASVSAVDGEGNIVWSDSP